MQEELKPCPFCGGKPELAPSGYVFCQKCLARTYELGNGAATWNKREHEREASINDLTVKVAQLEARLAALDWTPISEENPAVDGDEIGSYFDTETFGVTEYLAGSAKDLLQDRWTHRRPQNPPRDPSQEGSDAHGKDK